MSRFTLSMQQIRKQLSFYLHSVQKQQNSHSMLKNYFIIAWRNLLKSKIYSAINIIGLATGMAVAILIALWIWDELSYNNYFKNHQTIAQVMTTQTFNGETGSGPCSC